MAPSITINGSVNAMYLPDKLQKMEHESFQNDMHVEGENIDVEEGEAIKECNDTSIVFKSLKHYQENITMKSSQRQFNAINFKKSNMLL